MKPLTRDATAARLAFIAFVLLCCWFVGPVVGAPKVFGTACFWAAAMAAFFAALCALPDARRWLDKQVACRHNVTWEQQALEVANDACSDPPCDQEDWWICDAHLPRGKHHPPALRYLPMPPTVHNITDLKDWR